MKRLLFARSVQSSKCHHYDGVLDITMLEKG